MRPARESDVETIVAAATPPGRSALAVVRISGPDALSVARRICPGLPDPPAPRTAHLTSFRAGDGEIFDRGIVLYFSAPRSATGEDVIEAFLHGSPLLVSQFIDAATAAGARPARAGEFSRRAFLRGKVALPEVEALADVLEARTIEAARGAFSRGTRLPARSAAIRAELLAAHALWTAAIDFPEQAGLEDPGQIARHLERAGDDLDAEIESALALRRLLEGFRVVIAGPPNAGKSSVFNSLIGADRAIVSESPGTTRDTVSEEIVLEGIPVTLVDTAGLRDSGDPVESEGVARSRRELERADLVLFVHDSSRPFSEVEDSSESCPASRRILVSNKIDLPGPRPAPGAPVCAISKDARNILERILVTRLEALAPEESAGSPGLRHRDLLLRARTAVTDCRRALSQGQPAEIAVACLESGLAALSELAGETTAEESLDIVFSRFCIGK
jgi:tRNA modification GTPase